MCPDQERIGSLEDRYDVLIVGGGHAGAQAAISLRQKGHAKTVAILSDEPELPYERPPLSKSYLAGKASFEDMLIRPGGFWEEQGVDLLPGRTVVAVDPARHCVTLGDGRTVGYGALIWAAGGSARRLTCSGHDLRGVHVIRKRADIDRMKAELEAVSRIAVIGAGYIGLEAAAVLSGLGKNVTVIEAQDRVLARVAGSTLSRFYEGEHRAHGVDIRLQAGVERLMQQDGRVAGVHLADGTQLACDMAIVGIGIEPCVAPLLVAGAAGGNGVDVDEYCRTALPDIYAVGDCAAHENPFAGNLRIRLESVQNATDQAVVAAGAIVGGGDPYRSLPWFWSDQYDLRLQTAGLSHGHDFAVLRGDMAKRSFSVIYFRGRRVIALDCVNAPRDFMQGRKLVCSDVSLPLDRLADSAVPLKEFVARA